MAAVDEISGIERNKVLSAYETQPSVRCFQHCSGMTNILCFTVPDVCPLCGQSIPSTGMRIPPYLITSPFVTAADTVCSVVIKPTVSDFLTNFTNSSDLHVGLTDSKGQVYEFDENGVTVGKLDWTKCLYIVMIDSEDRMYEQWDQDIEAFAKGRHWKAELYDESRHNCFDFVLGFLRYFGMDRVYPCIIDRRLFCAELILPRTSKAGKYISLYRTIAQTGFSVQSTGNKQ